MGGVVSALYTKLSRDHGAAVMIGLLGNVFLHQWLFDLCKATLEGKHKVRTTHKGIQNWTGYLGDIEFLGTASKTESTARSVRSITPCRGTIGDYYNLGGVLKHKMEKLYAASCSRLSSIGGKGRRKTEVRTVSAGIVSPTVVFPVPAVGT